MQQVASRQYDAAHLDHIGALCECQRRVDILLNQQHRQAFGGDSADQAEQLMSLEGFVRVFNNSGEEYEDAQVRLVYGKKDMP